MLIVYFGNWRRSQIIGNQPTDRMAKRRPAYTEYSDHVIWLIPERRRLNEKMNKRLSANEIIAMMESAHAMQSECNIWCASSFPLFAIPISKTKCLNPNSRTNNHIKWQQTKTKFYVQVHKTNRYWLPQNVEREKNNKNTNSVKFLLWLISSGSAAVYLYGRNWTWKWIRHRTIACFIKCNI